MFLFGYYSHHRKMVKSKYGGKYSSNIMLVTLVVVDI